MLASIPLLGIPASAQTTPWAVDVARERVGVTNNGIEGVWTTDRAQLSWVRPEAGGWFASVERQTRNDVVNVTGSLRAYRRLGDWTLAGGGAATPNALFQYRYSAEGEVSRRVIGALVASTGYRFLAFRGQNLQQVQPSLAWYYPKGDVQVRLFVTRNDVADRTSPTLQLRTTFDATARLRLGGGMAIGDRIFDVTLLPTGRARSKVVFASARVGVTAHDAIEVGGAFADEQPAFTFRSFSLGYRRTF